MAIDAIAQSTFNSLAAYLNDLGLNQLFTVGTCTGTNGG